MPTQFVCLANSYKEKGRCVAGIVLEGRLNPIMEDGLPKWIRPISDKEHGEIPEELAADLNLLDILEINAVKPAGDGYQSENVTFRKKSIRKVGTFDSAKLIEYCDERPMLFGNKAKAIHEDRIHRLDHSLTLIHVTDFEAYEQESEYHPGRMTHRLSFNHNNTQYDLPITDPVFKHNYLHKADYLEDVDEMLLTLSVSLPLNKFYFKLVAGVIFI